MNLVPGPGRGSDADSVPVQDLPVLQQGAGLSGLPRAALRDCGGEPGDEAGDQVVGVQESAHPDGGRRSGETQKQLIN